ncbi:putative membrane protein [Pseudomonas sp. JUb42]|nr:putative membrane protein [Pseudomonas sp. JUb42]
MTLSIRQGLVEICKVQGLTVVLLYRKRLANTPMNLLNRR